jgi:hypothetical protein
MRAVEGLHMHIGATTTRFCKVTPRIVMGVKRVGGFGDKAVPEGGFWTGVKYGTPSAPLLRGAGG